MSCVHSPRWYFTQTGMQVQLLHQNQPTPSSLPGRGASQPGDGARPGALSSGPAPEHASMAARLIGRFPSIPVTSPRHSINTSSSPPRRRSCSAPKPVSPPRTMRALSAMGSTPLVRTTIHVAGAGTSLGQLNPEWQFESVFPVNRGVQHVIIILLYTSALEECVSGIDQGKDAGLHQPGQNLFTLQLCVMSPT